MLNTLWRTFVINDSLLTFHWWFHLKEINFERKAFSVSFSKLKGFNNHSINRHFVVKEKWRIDFFVGKIAGNSTPQRERALGVRECLIESGDKIRQNKRLVANSESVRVRLTWEEVLSLSSIWISISIFFVVFWYFSVVILINSCAFGGKRGVHCLNKKLIYSTHWSRLCEIMMARKTGKTSSR